MAAMFGFDVWSSDVKLAYLQSTEPLKRRVLIINPAPQFELEPHECFELLKPLYGLCDAGDLWHQTLHRHLVEDLQLESTKVDSSLYFCFRFGELAGINGTYVDDLLRAGDHEFRKKCTKTHKVFETSGDDPTPLTFSGFNVCVNDDGSLSIDQNFYRKQLECLDSASTFPDFRSMGMKLA